MFSTFKKLSATLLVFITLLIFLKPAGSLASTNSAAIIFSPPLGYGQSVRYGPRITFDNAGVLIETTDYGIQNPDLSHFSPCFNLSMSQLLHAGEDWYRMDGQSTAGATVSAVADGSVYNINLGNYPGYAMVLEHFLPSGQTIYSVYMHIGNIPTQLSVGQPVVRGQMIGTVIYHPYDGLYPQYHPSGDDSHLHFEIRYFASAANIYYDHPNCNYGDAAGRGYTYPGYPPDTYPNATQHYTDPGTFVRSYAGTYLPLIQRANCINGQQLISNRGFEDGGIHWVEETQPYYSVITNYSLPTPAYTGTWAAWFGGRNNAVERIYQSFSVLPGTTGANLLYYFWMRTDETSPGAYDKFRVRLRDLNDNLLQEIDYLDDNSFEYLWLPRSIIISNLSAFQGQTLRLSFEGSTDSSLVTDFLLDDISFTALCGGGPTPQSPQGLTTPTSLPQATPTGFIPTKPIAPTPTTTPTPITYP